MDPDTSAPVAPQAEHAHVAFANLGDTSARGVAWNVLQNLSGRILSLAVVAILGRLLPKEAFAAVALGLAVTAFAEILATQGYVEFIAQRPELTGEHLDTAFWLNLALGGALMAITILLASPIASMIGDRSVVPIMRWLSLSLVLRSASVVPVGILTRRMQFRALSVRSLVGSVVGGGAGVISALAGLGVYSLVIQGLVSEAGSVILLWSATEWRPGLKLSRARWNELFDFGVPVMGASLLNFAARRLDTFIVARALGLVSLGVYTMGQRTFQIANQILNKSGDAVALSALSRLAGAPEQRRAAFYRVVEVAAIVCFPIYIALAIIAHPFVVVLFGTQWADSAPVLIAFALSGVPLSLSYMHWAALKSTGRTRFFLLVHIVLVAAYIPLLIFVVNRGVTVAAGAYLVGCCIVLPVEVGLLKIAMDLRIADYLGALVRPAVVTLVTSAPTLVAAWATSDLSMMVQLVAQGLAASIGYVAGLWWFAPPSLKQTFRRLMRRSPTSPESGKHALAVQTEPADQVGPAESP